MSKVPVRSLIASLADLPDPRVERTRKHNLVDIITIAICAVLSGADSFVEIAAYGRAKESWLRTQRALPNGIPSHDTFGRVFALLEPAAFDACFLDWVREALGPVTDQVIAVDGKTVRRSHDRANGKGPLHLVSAWATETGVALGQSKVADHANEIVALPALLHQVVLPGAVVTADAMGCQRAVAATIVEHGGDYVLALKRNQPATYEAVQVLFTDGLAHGFAVDHLAEDTRQEHGHGRHEQRSCWAVEDRAMLDYLDTGARWPGLRSLVMVKSQRRIGETTQDETRYYLSSLPADAVRHNAIVRAHWTIENQMHWVLDVAFAEDQSRVRTGHADHNFAIVRRIALSLLKQDTTAKQGVKGKRLRAGWDNDYLLRVLFQ